MRRFGDIRRHDLATELVCLFPREECHLLSEGWISSWQFSQLNHICTIFSDHLSSKCVFFLLLFFPVFFRQNILQQHIFSPLSLDPDIAASNFNCVQYFIFFSHFYQYHLICYHVYHMHYQENVAYRYCNSML